MKLMLRGLLVVWCATMAALAQPPKFKHIVVIVQENRTPDNLFQGLCSSPQLCNADNPNDKQYNILTDGWKGKNGPIKPQAVPLVVAYDLGHGHDDFLAMCNQSGGQCRMDGAADVACKPEAACPPNAQFGFVGNFIVNSKNILNPYLDMATQYGWANYMFQSNQGPSFPAHQFLFGGTSAPKEVDDSLGIFASENMTGTGDTGGSQAAAGCAAPGSVQLIRPPDPPAKPFPAKEIKESKGMKADTTYPCFEHNTMADLLPSLEHGAWKYYTPSPSSIWTAPNSIEHICQPSGGKCAGPDWTNNLDFKPADVITDIRNCELRSVSWVIPTGQNSDHARSNDGGGPAWVASIVNEIGGSNCENGAGYWKDTAIFVTWDDWGGWYDHVAPPIYQGLQGDYQYGFRVPLIVISAYTGPGYISNKNPLDFGSILRFIQHNFGIQEGALGFTDKRATNDLTDFFNFNYPGGPRAFTKIDAQLSADFFLNDKRTATDPDDQ